MILVNDGSRIQKPTYPTNPLNTVPLHRNSRGALQNRYRFVTAERKAEIIPVNLIRIMPA